MSPSVDSEGFFYLWFFNEFEMKYRLLFILFLGTFIHVTGQDTNTDYSWWNELHGWEVGDPGWRNWMQIAPGYLGANALPVPDVKRGVMDTTLEVEVTASNHFSAGDPTQDISGRLFIPFAKNRIAIEMYGVVFEHYAFTTEVRDERFARDKDGKGTAIGDFYFSTLIQVIKDRKFPNTLFRFASKTASGNQLEAARYTDSPGYFFDLSFSKDLGDKKAGMFRPFGLFGFYSWQTNDELNLQNDAFMYALGTDYLKNNNMFSVSWSGYTGYKNERDRPMQLNLEYRKDFIKKAIRVRYLHGLRDWEYKTIKFSFIWKFNSVD
jgi:hypothetical protein